MRFTTDTLLRMRWQDRAACANERNFDAYFPRVKPRPELKRKCLDDCQVRAECLEFALANDAVGIWGGTSTKERRKIKEDRKVEERRGPPGIAS